MNRLLTLKEVRSRTKRLRHRKPDVTMFTDASAITHKKAAGWAGWAKGDRRGSQSHSGQLPFHPNTNILELYAILNMVETLVETGHIRRSDKSMIIQSDSLGALGYMLNSLDYVAMSHLPESALLNPMLAPPAAVPLVHRLHETLSSFEIVYVRHVRAHKDDDGSRHSVNNSCDELARQKARLGPVEPPDWLRPYWAF